MGCAMASQPAGVEQPIRFGEDYEVDLRPRRLRRGSHVLKLERIPFEILLLLPKNQAQLPNQRQRVFPPATGISYRNSIAGSKPEDCVSSSRIRSTRRKRRRMPEPDWRIANPTGGSSLQALWSQSRAFWHSW